MAGIDCISLISEREARQQGAVAQLGERKLCKFEVVGSIPSSSTNFLPNLGRARCLIAEFLGEFPCADFI